MKVIFGVTLGGILIIAVLWASLGFKFYTESELQSPEDKTYKIVRLIESTINEGEYNGCTCRKIDKNLIQCDLGFPAGSDAAEIILAVKEVADTFAQAAPLAATIYYAGYSGEQKICEFKYDMYTRTVSKFF